MRSPSRRSPLPRRPRSARRRRPPNAPARWSRRPRWPELWATARSPPGTSTPSPAPARQLNDRPAIASCSTGSRPSSMSPPTATVEEFAKRVKLEAQRIEATDGMDRYERQRRATRVSTWTDHDGMWNLRGRFDPLTGTRIASKLDQAVETLFAETTPEHAPSDPIEKQRFLTAEALARLITDNVQQRQARSGRVPRRHRRRLHRPVSSPTSTSTSCRRAVTVTGALADPRRDTRHRCWRNWSAQPTATWSGVVVCNGVVLHAPGSLDQGRTNRIANRAQRRSLRAMYATCSIPGCSRRASTGVTSTTSSGGATAAEPI